MGKYSDLIEEFTSKKIEEATAAWVIASQDRLRDGDWVHVWDDYEYSWDPDSFMGIRMKDIMQQLEDDDGFERRHEDEGTDYVRGWYVRLDR